MKNKLKSLKLVKLYLNFLNTDIFRYLCFISIVIGTNYLIISTFNHLKLLKGISKIKLYFMPFSLGASFMVFSVVKMFIGTEIISFLNNFFNKKVNEEEKEVTKDSFKEIVQEKEINKVNYNSLEEDINKLYYETINNGIIKEGYEEEWLSYLKNTLTTREAIPFVKELINKLVSLANNPEELPKEMDNSLIEQLSYFSINGDVIRKYYNIPKENPELVISHN